MSDALSLVRNATITKTAVNYQDSCYIFSNQKLHESTKTTFKRTLQRVEDYYYTLRDIIFFLENIDCAIGEYRRLCLDRKIVAVVEQDRASLKGYLTGEISTCPQINVVAQTAQGVSSDETSTPSMHSAVPRSAESAPLLPDADMLKIRLNRRSSKRKLIDCDGPDPTFLEADKRELRAKRTDEIPAQTRATVLSKPGADFSFVMKLFNDNFLRPKDARPSGASAHHSTLKDVSTGNNRKYAYATPYIIVPAALTGVLSIFNAQDLLQRAAYVSIEEKKQQPGAKRESVVIINRAMSDGRMEQYKVIDNPRALRPEDWEHRVVAVFVSGQVWQFKDWYWSNPAELFQNILGVHLTMDGRVVDSTVQSWNCNVLKISQFKRHNDAGVVNEFWAMVDHFLQFRKPWLVKPRESASVPATIPVRDAKDGRSKDRKHSSSGDKESRHRSSSHVSHAKR